MTPLAALFLVGISLFALAGLFSTLQDPKNCWKLIIVMILWAGFAIQVDRSGSLSNITWATSLQTLRAELFLGTGSLLFLGLLVNMGKVRLNDLPVQGTILFAIQILTSILRFDHEGAAEGAKSMVFCVVTMLPILCLLPRALKEWDDWLIVIRLFAYAAVLWAGATFIQVLIDHRQLEMGWQKRFAGMLGNPQGCGLYMAPMTFSLLWLLANEKSKKHWWLWVGTMSLMIVYSLWTGSRTCIIVTGFGAMFVLYAKLGRFILIAPIFLVVLYAFYQLALTLGLSTDAVERLASTQNTRESSWQILYEDAFQNPLLGSGFKQTRANENSYLLAFGAYGIFGGVLVLTLLFVSIGVMMKLLRYRPRVPAKHRQIVDLILGFNAAYFLGAMFEWHIVSRMEGNITYMLIFSVMTKQLIAKIDAESSLRDEFADEIEYYGQEEPKLNQTLPAG